MNATDRRSMPQSDTKTRRSVRMTPASPASQAHNGAAASATGTSHRMSVSASASFSGAAGRVGRATVSRSAPGTAVSSRRSAATQRAWAAGTRRRRGHRRSRRPAPGASGPSIASTSPDRACPYFPGKRYEDWKLDDPAGKGVESVRPIRDEIKDRIEKLLADLVPAS